MRKITKEAVNHFLNNKPYKKANTEVLVHDYATDGTITQLFLHGNIIAQLSDAGLTIRDGGWQSNTTKERLNGLPGVSICQKKGKWYLNGNEWNGEWIEIKQPLNEKAN